MARVAKRRQAEWCNVPSSARIPPRAVEAIARRRRQMLIHSYLYYRADTPIIDDALWTKWAQQLAKLHDKFGKRIGFYDKAFADWDGSTGFHLPADYDVVRVAQNLYREHAERLEIIG